MKNRFASDVMDCLDTRHIQEAESYRPARGRILVSGRAAGALAAAVVLLLCIVGGVKIFLLSPRGDVTAYACSTIEEITTAGAVISTGAIRDSGEMTGQPLRFFLSGSAMEKVRFSCKNEKIRFVDWTEKREEYGNARNFTVVYGEDESEYPYLTVEWIPETVIRRLTDEADSTIATLPEEMKKDIIVMEILFADGRKSTKAITVSLLDNGVFYAAFDDYKISDGDAFVRRPDSKAIPREILYAQGAYPQGATEGEKAEEQQGTPPQAGGQEEAEGQGQESAEAQARQAAEAYYRSTVFELVSLEPKSGAAEEIVFWARVKKGGVLQEPDRMITLRLTDGIWKVVNEGY